MNNRKQGKPIPHPGYYTTTEASNLLNISGPTLRNYAIDGKLPENVTMRKGRIWFFKKSYIDNVIVEINSGVKRVFP
jgi:excisionase family DNA binding protein